MKQELYCHNCDKYVLFSVPAYNGRLIVRCPNCGHEHYRIVENGEITAERWGSSNRPIVYAVNVYISSTSSATDTFLYQSWTSASSTNNSGW